MLIRSIAAWLAILALAVLNGALREALLLPNLGRPAAYAMSALLLALVVCVVAVASARWMGAHTARRAMAVGILWLALTLVFEFGFGLAQGHSWPQMLEAYTFKDGNLWPLVLVVVLLAPLLAWRLRRRW